MSQGIVTNAGYKRKRRRSVSGNRHARMISSVVSGRTEDFAHVRGKLFETRGKNQGVGNDHLTGESVGHDAGKLRCGARDNVAANPNPPG